ncbi:MAG: serine hydrolase domain-containing protein [Dehalococcoidia bacterium]
MDTQRLDQILEEATGDGRLPGLVATLGGRSDVLYEGAAGVREAGGGALMTPDTVLNIASMIKAVTAAAAMQCVERGLLDLDQPAGEIIPFLGRVEVLEGFDAGGQPKLRPARTAVTLRNLLTHTSGFGYEIWNAGLGRYQEVTGTPGLGTGLNASLEMPLVFEPGTAWEYGIGIDWAGKLVEAVTGTRLRDFMRQELFEPLGMKSTGFQVTAEMAGRRAAGHVRTADGIVPTRASGRGVEWEYDAGGGGLSSTVQDYLQFARMILNGGELDGHRILRPETIALMSQSHTGPVDIVPMRTAMPAVSQDCDFFPGMRQEWGLSFLINTAVSPEGRSAGSLAWAGLLNTYYWIDRERDVAGVFGTQLLPFFDAEVLRAFRRFERAVYGDAAN